MMNLAEGRDVYIITGRTDLRFGIDSLCGVVQDTFGLDPCDALYLFCGRRADRMKAIYWDDDRGFVLVYARLENGHYQWPRKVCEARKISAEQYRRLMEGYPLEENKTIRPVDRKWVTQ